MKTRSIALLFLAVVTASFAAVVSTVKPSLNISVRQTLNATLLSTAVNGVTVTRSTLEDGGESVTVGGVTLTLNQTIDVLTAFANQTPK